MSWISVYIKAIAVIILIRPVLTGLLPNERLARHISFTAGLIIITVIAAPFGKMTVDELFSGFEAVTQAPDYESLSHNQLKEKFTALLTKELEKKFKTEKIKVTADDNLNVTDISCPDKEIQKKIKEYLGI